MPLSPRLVIFTRTAGIAFWAIAACFGLYWILIVDIGGKGFMVKLHGFSTGLLLFLVGGHMAYAEVRDLIPGFEAKNSRSHQFGLACLHMAVGGFITGTPKVHLDGSTEFDNHPLGLPIFVAGCLLGIMKVVFSFQHKDQISAAALAAAFGVTNQTPSWQVPTADSNWQPQPASNWPAASTQARGSFDGTGQRTTPLLNEDERDRLPVARGSISSAPGGREDPFDWSGFRRPSTAQSPFGLEERPATAESARPMDETPGSGLCPNVARWNPDATPGFSQQNSNLANPFAAG